MRTVGTKVIVKIDKKLQSQKREKIGNMYIPDYLMNYKRNLQFGEVVNFGNKVLDVCPEIEIGCIAIFHHSVEFKVVNKNKEDGSESIEETDDYLIDTLENGDELRHLSATNDIGCELFGVWKNGTIFPSKHIVFCKPNVKQSGFQEVKGIFINNDEDKQKIKDEIEIIQHKIDEFLRVVTQMPESETTYRMIENTKVEITNAQNKKKALKKRLNKITLAELEVVYLPNTNNIQNVNIGDKILSDSKFIYPLDLFGTEFALIREFKIIHGKVIDGKPVPINDRVFIKQDKAQNEMNGFIIPDRAQEKPFSGIVLSTGEPYDYPMDIKEGDHVIFHPLGMIEIFIDDVAYLIIHSQNVLAKVEEALLA